MIVVTGAGGHIGNVLVRELLQQNKKPIKALLLPNENQRSLEGLNIEMVTGDVRDLNFLKEAFKNVETVFHLAGVISITTEVEDVMCQVNVEGTNNVIAACRSSNVGRLVYVSSIHALVEPPGSQPITETCGFNPNIEEDTYEKTKAIASLNVLDATKKGLNAVVVCPTGVIGPYDFRVSEMGAMIIDFVKGNLKASTEGAYDFVDVRDIAQGLILASEKGTSGEVYLLGGERVTVSQLLQLLAELTNREVPNVTIPGGLMRFFTLFTPFYYKLTKQKPLFTPYSIKTLQSNSFVDDSKAEKELEYQKRPIKDSLKDAIEWFRTEGYLL